MAEVLDCTLLVVIAHKNIHYLALKWTNKHLLPRQWLVINRSKSRKRDCSFDSPACAISRSKSTRCGYMHTSILVRGLKWKIEGIRKITILSSHFFFTFLAKVSAFRNVVSGWHVLAVPSGIASVLQVSHRSQWYYWCQLGEQLQACAKLVLFLSICPLIIYSYSITSR